MPGAKAMHRMSFDTEIIVDHWVYSDENFYHIATEKAAPD